MITNSSVQKTLAYFAIFDYPPTETELTRYLIGDEPEIKTLERSDSNKRIYSDLHNKNTYDPLRRKRAWNYIEKTRTQLVPLLCKLPFVHTIAITGSTAALDTPADGDIDILLIVTKNTGWITRFLTLSILKLLNLHVNTKLSQKENRGKYCVNLILEQSTNDLTQSQKDIYTAMELAHMKIIYNRETGFESLLYANAWLFDFLPNFWQKINHEWQINNCQPATSESKLRLINSLAEKLQHINYKFRHDQSVSLASHWPTNHRNQILAKYKENLLKLNQT